MNQTANPNTTGAEAFIESITLGNALQSDIKSYIRRQARRIMELEARLEMIQLHEHERRINRQKKSLQKLLSKDLFF